MLYIFAELSENQRRELFVSYVMDYPQVLSEFLEGKKLSRPVADLMIATAKFNADGAVVEKIPDGKNAIWLSLQVNADKWQGYDADTLKILFWENRQVNLTQYSADKLKRVMEHETLSDETESAIFDELKGRLAGKDFNFLKEELLNINWLKERGKQAFEDAVVNELTEIIHSNLSYGELKSVLQNEALVNHRELKAVIVKGLLGKVEQLSFDELRDALTSKWDKLGESEVGFEKKVVSQLQYKIRTDKKRFTFAVLKSALEGTSLELDDLVKNKVLKETIETALQDMVRGLTLADQTKFDKLKELLKVDWFPQRLKQAIFDSLAAYIHHHKNEARFNYTTLKSALKGEDGRLKEVFEHGDAGKVFLARALVEQMESLQLSELEAELKDGWLSNTDWVKDKKEFFEYAIVIQLKKKIGGLDYDVLGGSLEGGGTILKELLQLEEYKADIRRAVEEALPSSMKRLDFDRLKTDLEEKTFTQPADHKNFERAVVNAFKGKLDSKNYSELKEFLEKPAELLDLVRNADIRREFREIIFDALLFKIKTLSFNSLQKELEEDWIQAQGKQRFKDAADVRLILLLKDRGVFTFDKLQKAYKKEGGVDESLLWFIEHGTAAVKEAINNALKRSLWGLSDDNIKDMQSSDWLSQDLLNAEKDIRDVDQVRQDADEYKFLQARAARLEKRSDFDRWIKPMLTAQRRTDLLTRVEVQLTTMKTDWDQLMDTWWTEFNNKLDAEQKAKIRDDQSVHQKVEVILGFSADQKFTQDLFSQRLQAINSNLAKLTPEQCKLLEQMPKFQQINANFNETDRLLLDFYRILKSHGGRDWELMDFDGLKSEGSLSIDEPRYWIIDSGFGGCNLCFFYSLLIRNPEILLTLSYSVQDIKTFIEMTEDDEEKMRTLMRQYKAKVYLELKKCGVNLKSNDPVMGDEQRWNPFGAAQMTNDDKDATSSLLGVAIPLRSTAINPHGGGYSSPPEARYDIFGPSLKDPQLYQYGSSLGGHFQRFYSLQSSDRFLETSKAEDLQHKKDGILRPGGIEDDIKQWKKAFPTLALENWWEIYARIREATLSQLQQIGQIDVNSGRRDFLLEQTEVDEAKLLLIEFVNKRAVSFYNKLVQFSDGIKPFKREIDTKDIIDLMKIVRNIQLTPMSLYNKNGSYKFDALYTYNQKAFERSDALKESDADVYQDEV